MKIKDPFSYSARWDSIGLDCSYCSYFRGPDTWPDKEKISHCCLHKISLSIELGQSGYKEKEWFCRDFNNKDAFPKAVEEFLKIKEKLEPKILYRGYDKSGYLVEYQFAELIKST